jgi:hypothetical protein
MPGAHPPAKYLCLLLATFAFFLLTQRNLCPLRNRQQSTFACCWLPLLVTNATQLMPGAQKQGRQKCNAKATGEEKVQATYARCAEAREATGEEKGDKVVPVAPSHASLLLRSGHKLLADANSRQMYFAGGCAPGISCVAKSQAQVATSTGSLSKARGAQGGATFCFLVC